MRLPLLLLIGIGLLALAAPLLAPYDPLLTRPEQALQPPSGTFLLGTDHLGRDVLSRTLWGGRRTLSLALLATAWALLPGVAGALLAVSVPRLDGGLRLLVNTWLAFPPLALALLLVTLTGPGTAAVALAVGLAQGGAVLRVCRAGLLALAAEEYVLAARAQGAAGWHIARVHLLRGLWPLLRVLAGITFSYCLFNSAALSLLGLAGQPGSPDWGVMLADGRQAFRAAPWAALAPGLAITLTMLCLNALTDHDHDHDHNRDRDRDRGSAQAGA
ncbi:MAG: ABC transporter permease subunit [Anaerolineae bacterium]|nr:ABC transporter permease subunit [Anaerolineae bacterium]